MFPKCILPSVRWLTVQICLFFEANTSSNHCWMRGFLRCISPIWISKDSKWTMTLETPNHWLYSNKKGSGPYAPRSKGCKVFRDLGLTEKCGPPKKVQILLPNDLVKAAFGLPSFASFLKVMCLVSEWIVFVSPTTLASLTTPRITTCGSRILQIYLSAKNMCPLPNLTKLDPPAADRLFSGTGPLEGWISCSVNGKALVMEARWRRGCGFSRCQFLWTDLAGTPSTGKFKYSMKLDRSFSKNMRVAKRIDESLFVRVETIWISEISRKPFDSTSLVGDLAKGA